MIRLNFLRLRPALLAILLISWTPAQAADIYATDFESFTAGSNQWAGTDGWVSNVDGSGVHGIDNNIVSGLGKTAYLGYYPPTTNFVTILRPVSYDPVSNNTPVIRFESLMGIQDSTNGRGDSFFVSFYNMAGQFLAAIRFSNNPFTLGIWRDDDASEIDTGLDFFPGQLHLLRAEIDFATNRWTASLDGIPLFTDAVFNASGKTLNLLAVASEWKLTSQDTALYGNNWLLVADWRLWTVPPGLDTVVIEALSADTNGIPQITWFGEPGFTYELQYTADFQSWRTNLAGAVFSDLSSTQTLTYGDASYTDAGGRSYRVQRTITP